MENLKYIGFVLGLKKPVFNVCRLHGYALVLDAKLENYDFQPLTKAQNLSRVSCMGHQGWGIYHSLLRQKWRGTEDHLLGMRGHLLGIGMTGYIKR